MTPLAALACLAFGWADGGPSGMMPPDSAFAALGDDAVQDLVILGENRPILVRLRVMIGDRPFRSAWLEATRTLHAQFDRDGDGKLTVAEADAGGLPLLVAPASPNPNAARPPVEVDVKPKDGVISVDELVETLRSPSGPFRVQVDRVGDRRTDALFDHLDRDKDGQLTRPERESLVGALRKLDRDDNELISEAEVSAAGGLPAAAPAIMGRPARDTAVPPVVELVAGESPLRVVRLLLRKYDTGSSRGPGKTDSRLSPEEFAIPSQTFKAADTGGDGLLNTEELRKYLAQNPTDIVVDVALAAESKGRALVRGQGEAPPEGLTIRPLGAGVVEVDIGPIRLDIHVDDGAGGIDSASRALHARFDAADANQDGYLEEAELNQNNGQSPFAGFFRPIDRDGDGKIYPTELDAFVARQAESSRGRLTLNASNEGRALFGMLDLDRDRQLGAREVLDASARVSVCDRDRDGRIIPDEVPHHIQLTLTRGDFSSILAPAPSNPAVLSRVNTVFVPISNRPAAGPAWFRRMDRNRDGDVSRREFLGTLNQFDRLDGDHDGLLSPSEAEAARPAVNVKGPGG